MPIVDGLSSTKMIRSHEKITPSHSLSQRAALNGRVPIIAVSASLIEKDKQTYTDAGFDGWILKPISFDRLSNIMDGIVDSAVRKENLYKPGSWERGGWFDKAQKDLYVADTKPDDDIPQSMPSEDLKIAASSDDPQVKEDEDSAQTQEQARLEGGMKTLDPRKIQSVPDLSATKHAHQSLEAQDSLPEEAEQEERVTEDAQQDAAA